jgi:anti-sigma regulatory factor (Ser/Thr protein kinase)
MKEIVLDAKRENLPQLFEFITKTLREYSDDEKTIRKVKLCVEEAFMNIAAYAYDPEVGPAKVSVTALGEPYPLRVQVVFTDNGKPFNPLKAENPDVESGLEDRQVGGLGIFLIKKEMDDITYEYRDGQNILTLEKKFEKV